jgi:DNA-binding CsgD family transcriptional regulator
MRSNRQPRFSASEFQRLSALAPVVSAALVRQWAQAGAGPQPAPQPTDEAEDMEAAFRSFGSDLLSSREQMIVSLVLRGHSSSSIGLVLKIAEGTVKNHRKHIHAKLGVSSQAELFNLFVRHVRRH